MSMVATRPEVRTDGVHARQQIGAHVYQEIVIHQQRGAAAEVAPTARTRRRTVRALAEELPDTLQPPLFREKALALAYLTYSSHAEYALAPE